MNVIVNAQVSSIFSLTLLKNAVSHAYVSEMQKNLFGFKTTLTMVKHHWNPPQDTEKERRGGGNHESLSAPTGTRTEFFCRRKLPRKQHNLPMPISPAYLARKHVNKY